MIATPLCIGEYPLPKAILSEVLALLAKVTKEIGEVKLTPLATAK